MTLQTLHSNLITCTRCPRLVEWREFVGLEKRRAYRDHEYWAKPVPGFGDPAAQILIFGLAPGAHGSNRTGRPFTGDASGGFLYPALYRAGLANQADSISRDDGMQLRHAYITAAVRCAPPANKPLPHELKNCSSWTDLELSLLPNVKVYLALGKIAHDALLDYHGLRKSLYPFGHSTEYLLPNGITLLSSYHVSRQNTNTGKLTAAMFDLVVARANHLAGLD
jgi:uracil-DNA glycosylase family 4